MRPARRDGYDHPAARTPNTYSQLVFCKRCSGADLTRRACFTRAGFSPGETLPGAVPVLVGNVVVGHRCAFCATGSVDTVDAARGLIDGAVNWLDGWLRERNDKLPNMSGLVEYRLPDERTLQSTDSGQTLGRCTKLSGSGQARYRIEVLYGMRTVSFVETLMHEPVHVWAYETGLDRRVYIDGFCNFVAHAYLSEFGGTGSAERQEAQRRQAMMMEDSSPIYGSNFKAFRLVSKNAPNIVGWFKESADAK
jgi:hypothetical protein